MKGKSCSLADIRKIKRILEQKEKLKGQYDALMRCAGRTTLIAWREAIEVMDACPISDMKYIQPSHMTEIARHAERENWQKWVSICESQKLTIATLRSRLAAHNSRRATITAEQAAPEGKYHAIVIDPPWAYGNNSGRQKQAYHQRTMSVDEVGAFNLARWIPDDFCHLYLWVTDAYAGDVYQVTRAWGFDPKAWIVWEKDRIGMGNYFRHQHEFCVFAVKGKMRLKRRDLSTILRAPVGAHSEKPDAFYNLVQMASPGPYLDVFARKMRAGWDVFGDEIVMEYQQKLEGNNACRIQPGR